MNDYDFSTLNDKEFERLALDLLNSQLEISFQGFKVGKDKGVDLRYSTARNNNEIVVQVKHYVGSKYAQLKHTMKSKELDKIKLLNPDRYLVVTSLPLSASEKDELKKLLTPFVISSSDILGKDDLNQIIRNNPEIEKNHFKLWFSSTHILKSILNNAIEGRTKHHLESVKNKVPYYVLTKKLDDANKILEKFKLLLITGQPGIGKTTLADILLFERAKKNVKIYKVENIREAEDVISENPNEKQLFYFDDFLGANYFEIISTNKTESQLTSFVERIKTSPNKYLILTTRTIILNHALDKYEKIVHSRIADQQFELRLTDYSRYEKALILYNHLYFNGVKEDLYNSIISEKFYRKVIGHKNYTPRIIEFITDKTKIENFSPIQYHQFIQNNLDNPAEIWRYSFTNQIDYPDRCLLLTLFTFPREVEESIITTAFENRLIFEKTHHNHIIQSNQFDHSVKILLDGFISSTIIKKPKRVREFSFINPSLRDFLIGYCRDSYQERKCIITSLTYAEQLHQFTPQWRSIPLEKDLQKIIREKIEKNELKFTKEDRHFCTDNYKLCRQVDILLRFCGDINTDALMHSLLSQVDFQENIEMVSGEILGLLQNIGDSPTTLSFIKYNFHTIIEALMMTIKSNEDAELIPLLFEKYDFEFDEYIESEKGLGKILDLISNILNHVEEELIEERKGEVNDLSEVESLYEEVGTIEYELINCLLPNTNISHDFDLKIDKSFWNEQIKENEESQRLAEEQADKYYDHYEDAYHDAMDEESEIDDLFYRED